MRRDPHHFEFRGTVEMALAIAAHSGAELPPMGATPTPSEPKVLGWTFEGSADQP